MERVAWRMNGGVLIVGGDEKFDLAVFSPNGTAFNPDLSIVRVDTGGLGSKIGIGLYPDDCGLRPQAFGEMQELAVIDADVDDGRRRKIGQPRLDVFVFGPAAPYPGNRQTKRSIKRNYSILRMRSDGSDVRRMFMRGRSPRCPEPGTITPSPSSETG